MIINRLCVNFEIYLISHKLFQQQACSCYVPNLLATPGNIASTVVCYLNILSIFLNAMQIYVCLYVFVLILCFCFALFSSVLEQWALQYIFVYAGQTWHEVKTKIVKKDCQPQDTWT